MRKKRGRPPKGADALVDKRQMRVTAGEGREIDAALAVERKEFSEFARPLIVAGARKSIAKARR